LESTPACRRQQTAPYRLAQNIYHHRNEIRKKITQKRERKSIVYRLEKYMNTFFQDPSLVHAQPKAFPNSTTAFDAFVIEQGDTSHVSH
jgi:hypothetical protein